MKKQGICHICGKESELSFEHVPPKKAFNNRPILLAKIDDLLSKEIDKIKIKKIQQKGMGDYTLCEKCNNDTGAWYGKFFVEWCKDAFNILEKTNLKPHLIYMHNLYPLAIIKQIITMFFSANINYFHLQHPELVEFILNREKRFLSNKYKIYIYYNIKGQLRYLAHSVKIKPSKFINGKSKFISMTEITYPPLGYLLTIDSNKPDARLYDITKFANYSYYCKFSGYLDLPILETNTQLPGDYRTKKELDEVIKGLRK